MTSPAPAPIIGVDQLTGAVTAAFDRLATDRANRLEGTPDGGPCRFCGTTRSPEPYTEPHTPGIDQPERRWWPAHDVCGPCHGERLGGPGGERSPVPDDRHRWRVVARLLGDTTYGWVGEHGLSRTGFQWWFETGTPPAAEPFAYVDVAALRATLEPQPWAPEFETHEPCPRCGVADRWVTTTGPVVRTITDAPVLGGSPYAPALGETFTVTEERTETTCHGCQHLPAEPGRRKPGGTPALDEFAAQLTGLRRTTGAAALLGLTYWTDHSAANRDARPPTEPFGWWPDRDEIRARAWDLAGRTVADISELGAANRWTNLRAFERARAAFETRAAQP